MRIKGCLSVLVASVIAVASHSAAAEGDLASGEKLFKRCKACHSLEAGKKKVGPSLAGVFGRTAGTLEGFKFSKAMIASEVVWDEETIDQYLEKPKTFIPKNKMAFPGFKKPEQRADIIAYLKEATAQ